MRHHLRLILSLLALTALLILPYFVFAQSASSSSALNNLTTVATGGGYQQSSLATTVGIIIAAALSLLGAIFIILMVVGGYVWMTAEGNDQKVEKAQNYIRRAIIGLVITFSAWAIWSFVLTRFILISK